MSQSSTQTPPPLPPTAHARAWQGRTAPHRHCRRRCHPRPHRRSHCRCRRPMPSQYRPATALATRRQSLRQSSPAGLPQRQLAGEGSTRATTAGGPPALVTTRHSQRLYKRRRRRRPRRQTLPLPLPPAPRTARRGAPPEERPRPPLAAAPCRGRSPARPVWTAQAPPHRQKAKPPPHCRHHRRLQPKMHTTPAGVVVVVTRVAGVTDHGRRCRRRRPQSRQGSAVTATVAAQGRGADAGGGCRKGLRPPQLPLSSSPLPSLRAVAASVAHQKRLPPPPARHPPAVTSLQMSPTRRSTPRQGCRTGHRHRRCRRCRRRRRRQRRHRRLESNPSHSASWEGAVPH